MILKLNYVQFSTPNCPYQAWVFLFINLFSFCLSDPRTYQAGLFCGRATQSRTNYVPTFVREMENLLQLVTANQWGNYSVNLTTVMYGLAQCHHDLSDTDCLLCFAAGRTRLPTCLPAFSGRIYLDGCFIRYDNYSFYNESTDASWDRVNCSSSLGGSSVNGARASVFRSNVGQLIDNLTRTAPANEGFAVGEVDGVYGLAECWNSVSSDGCRECLEKAGRNVTNCAPSREGRAMYTGCYLRYSTERFYGTEGANNDSRLSPGIIIGIAMAGAAFFSLLLFAAHVGYARSKKLKEERNNLGNISLSYNKSGLNFKYETLERATDYFDESRKLGEGGAGSVFKGTLTDGRTVAVKRLFFNTRQWVDEFFNEVNLVSGIQHKNLVQLLGCSIEGPESLLVYEYVPNKSVDRNIFDKNKIQILNWNQRFNIIVGTAEGLAYLHGGCGTRIIHRDIKSSNILLDENLDPKIADFGLARCVAADQSHLSTGIAGTLGYMAPEYLVRGQLTEKADVYSFGVLVLEIVSGRRSNVFVENSVSLLQSVWKLYKTNRLAESVDPCLKNDFPTEDASIVLQIGLLCAQASVALRPAMAEVVQMLINKNYEIPQPNQPPFLNASVLQPERSSGSYSSVSVSNPLLKFGGSDTSTESSGLHSSDGPSRSHELPRSRFYRRSESV